MKVLQQMAAPEISDRLVQLTTIAVQAVATLCLCCCYADDLVIDPKHEKHGTNSSILLLKFQI